MGTAAISRYRRGVDNDIPSAQVRQGGLSQIEHRENICTKSVEKLLGSDFFYSLFLYMLFGRIVHEYVQSAKFRHDTLNNLSAKLFITDIPGNEYTSRSGRFDQARSFPGVVMFFEINDGYIRAFFGEGDCNRSADPTISTRNQSDIAGKLVGG